MGTGIRLCPIAWTTGRRTDRRVVAVGAFARLGRPLRGTVRCVAMQRAANEMEHSFAQTSAANDDGVGEVVRTLFEIGDAELRDVCGGWSAVRRAHGTRLATNAFRLRQKLLQLRLTIEALLSLADDEGAR